MQAGRVGRPHGLDGSFYVTGAEPSLLALGTPVRAGGRDTAIARRAGTDVKPIVRLEGCATREAAEALRGEPLWVARAVAPPLEEDEFWADDLVGLAVVDGEREVGTVDRVLSLPSCDVLVVGDLLVPLVDDAVREVDLEAGRVEIDLAFLGDAG